MWNFNLAFFQNSRQDEFLKPGSVDLSARNFSSMPPPKKLSPPGSDGMPPPPPRNMPPPPPKFATPQSPTRTEIRASGIEGLPSRNMPPPPPPPKFSAPILPSKSDIRNSDMKKSNIAAPVPDTLLKLAEYGDEDDDVDDPGDESSESHQTWSAPSKPFWAV